MVHIRRSLCETCRMAMNQTPILRAPDAQAVIALTGQKTADRVEGHASSEAAMALQDGQTAAGLGVPNEDTVVHTGTGDDLTIRREAHVVHVVGVPGKGGEAGAPILKVLDGIRAAAFGSESRGGSETRFQDEDYDRAIVGTRREHASIRRKSYGVDSGIVVVKDGQKTRLTWIQFARFVENGPQVPDTDLAVHAAGDQAVVRRVDIHRKNCRKRTTRDQRLVMHPSGFVDNSHSIA
mmetsp:Transcript_29442/g.54034  ORF Transcript_29442/g.54034 Transcript_29442/m.54034 type:complete len:237 (-) Transcript_29442:70-780(-)